uniref:Uncharacterized protein n=1 Tax=Anguilla anguilla TaxID=7936 RepID=A0A0E9RGP8_ANGAN
MACFFIWSVHLLSEVCMTRVRFFFFAEFRNVDEKSMNCCYSKAVVQNCL